jgi:hypothetical protein
VTAATGDAGTPQDEATPVCAGQLALFPVRTSRRLVSYTRPDGGPLTDADFDHLARLARTASGAAPTHERPTPSCR